MLGIAGYFVFVKKSGPIVSTPTPTLTVPTTPTKVSKLPTKTDGLKVKSVKTIVASTAGTTGKHPKFSNDGKKIIYREMDGKISGKNAGLWIVNSDGTGLKKLTNEIPSGGGMQDFGLSPDGNMFAYYKTKDNGEILLESDIYVMNVDGTGKKKLTESGNKMAMEPSWSPDGSKITFFYYGTGEIGITEIEKSI